jgi:aldose 1-epimerase
MVGFFFLYLVMFSIHSHHHNGFDIIALSDETNGTSVEIIPAHGAMLHAFTAAGQNVIDNYASLEEYNALRPEYFKSAKLSPFACRIPDSTYVWETQTYVVSKSAIHGLLYDATFIVLSVHADENSAVVKLFHHYEGTDKGYPFPYECTVTYELKAGNTLKLSTSIRNLSGEAIPLMDGWHPYFTTGGFVDELELQFTSSQIVEFNAQLVPTGRTLPWDQFSEFSSLANVQLDNSFILDFYGLKPQCELRDPKKRISICFFPEESYRILQIYIPPHRRSIAIENLTGAPNAFNNGIGLETLDADAEKTYSTTIVVNQY